MITYIFGYLAYLGGMLLYTLSKVQDFKTQAKANPHPDFKFTLHEFWNDEWINMLRMLIAGIALVLLLPMLIGGATVDLKNTSGSVITTLTLKTVLIPIYFFLAYSGNSAVFALFGKYKKTFLNQLGVEEDK